MRDAAEHVCPAFWMPALTRNGSAASRSASAKTICGLLPPSSSVTGTAFLAAAICTSAPVATEPVNERWSTPGCAASAAPGLLAEAGDDVERARRQAGLGADAREREHGQARLLGGLEHAGVAHRQRRADAAADDLHRVVPGHDVAGDAVRLAQGERGVAGGEGQRLAVHLVAGAGVELAVARQRDRIGARLLERLADVVDLELGEQLDVVEHLLADRGEDAAALDRALPAPGGAVAAVERGARGSDGGIDVGRAAAGDARELAAVGRILERERRARVGGLPAPADENVVGRKWDQGRCGGGS